jgi:L-alanine-DL-glutamate epimerase-like enolase superfamily enzyme
MPKPTDICLAEITWQFESLAYRTPIKFGGRVVSDAVLFHVQAEVETRTGRRGVGHGSMPLGNVWSWPSSQLSADATLAAMRDLAARMAAAAAGYRGFGHPLEITHELAAGRAALADRAAAELSLPEPIPALASMVCASPIEAAIHDAYGQALEQNVYHLLGPEFANRDLAPYLSPEFAGEYLDRYTLRQPKPRMPLYHLVGALDPLAPADVAQPMNDGLPETLGQWIARDELTHLKIKLNGDDLRWDLERVLRVEGVAAAAQKARGCDTWHYSLDFNEKCRDVEYLLEFLRRLGEHSPQALDRVQYIEQPTHRDLKAHPDHRLHAAARIKPVVIDESLVDFESLLLCRQMGYSGVALKACKGQTESLLLGAAAQKYGMFLCVQDLTCPGRSFLHSASLAARVPGVAAIEGNARQYCPAGNRDWEPRYPGMFRVRQGSVETGLLCGNGLGY